jgi:hypothetical protein
MCQNCNSHDHITADCGEVKMSYRHKNSMVSHYARGATSGYFFRCNGNYYRAADVVHVVDPPTCKKCIQWLQDQNNTKADTDRL